MAKVKRPSIDRDALRAALHRLTRGDLLAMIDRALEHLSDDALQVVLAGHITVADLAPKVGSSKALLADVERFCRAAKQGDYHEGFNVNSRNFMEKSEGTKAFMAALDGLYARCVRAAERTPDRATRDALEKLFALEAAVDEDPDAIVFFADEGGAWQFGTDWRVVLPAWFRCLAPTAAPEEFAREVDGAIRAHCEDQRAKLLPTARAVASAAQKQELAALRAKREK